LVFRWLLLKTDPNGRDLAPVFVFGAFSSSPMGAVLGMSPASRDLPGSFAISDFFLVRAPGVFVGVSPSFARYDMRKD